MSAPDVISCARACLRLPPPAHCVCLRPCRSPNRRKGRIRLLPVCCARPSCRAAERAASASDPPGGAGVRLGKREIPAADGRPSHNLFGIKATSDWRGKTTEITTTEYINGVKQKVKAAFRVYDSYEHALADYAKLLTNNPRYRGVVQSGSPEQGRERCRRGYATDPAYAKSSSPLFRK